MEQNLSLRQRLLLAPSMLTSLEVLLKPLPELSRWLEERIEENPLLMADFPSGEGFGGIFRCNPKLESTASVEPKDLYEILIAQAREAFPNPPQLQKAIDLIHQIDKKGYLPPIVTDSPILSILQSFDPPGIAARSVQEALILQLRRKGSSPLALAIVEEHYDDLLAQRLKKLSLHLNIPEEELRLLIQHDLASLSLAPGDIFQKQYAIPWIPDLTIHEEDGLLHVEINTSLLPKIALDTRYKNQAHDEETKSYLRWKGKDAYFVLQALRKRAITLKKIGYLLIKTQRPYFIGKRDTPFLLTVDQAAECLKLHRSTIDRAIHEKVIGTPRGILPLEAFFRHSRSIGFPIEEKIDQLILNEDKRSPLSDNAIAKHLRQLGLPCSRRTVAKYRQGMQLPKAHLRKQ